LLQIKNELQQLISVLHNAFPPIIFYLIFHNTPPPKIQHAIITTHPPQIGEYITDYNHTAYPPQIGEQTADYNRTTHPPKIAQINVPQFKQYKIINNTDNAHQCVSVLLFSHSGYYTRNAITRRRKILIAV
jgi:hypothetical protein